MNIQILSDLKTKGKDGKIYKVKRGEKEMIAKIFRKNKNKDEIEKEFRFLHKAAKLGISPKTYGYDLDDEKHGNYILMEELDKSLLDHIKKDGCLSDKYQKKIIKILEILDENNIFHGDISPLNFMTDKKGNLYIIDYGLAKEIDENFIKKYGKNANIKLGITAFILKIREFVPSFDPILLKNKVFSKLNLNM
jgi:predicted Ser/Thr protein kinase